MSEPIYELRVILLGPERTVERHYGPTQERDTLANLDVPVTAERGWLIYQQAVQRAVGPDIRIEFPEGVTHEEAAEWLKTWRDSHGERLR